ncbi:NmrA family NAD(P)-binding protein [Streptomyces sp. SP18BB07]|uniref:NmrA family NAD(P)-binding protein n=1 Tax=Streptomyces sp. SP18BB07 TaxID=3002522 RepID=UPI002E791B20|nr:NAD(P)H-binding protein [Streptomyces sp. SP18BB07]MEE1759406.1 NmrA family NAD(P)-binding protein [Streptomyces sp. SP18BB07]
MTENTENTENTARTQDMTVVVTGASGRTGSRVAEAARAAGLTVRAASRASGFDWLDGSTWAPALRGADAAYLVYPSDIGAPGAAPAIGGVAREAVAQGVRRLVLLSARGQDLAAPAEQAVRASGAEWTIVRAAWFMQNFSEGPLVEGLRQGELVFPGGEVQEPFVDVRDIADVVVAALTSGDAYVGRTVEVTGARLLSFREAVAEISAVMGRALAYVPVSARDYGDQLLGFGVPAEEVASLVEAFEGLLDGRNASVSDGVRAVLGREARDFGEFVREAAGVGVWKA